MTPGNSSPLNDGAAALLVTSRDYAREHGLEAMAVVRSIAVAGVPPRVMGIGPVPAVAKALDRAGVTMDDIGLVELNEAFAAQSLAVLARVGDGARGRAPERQRRGDRSGPPARVLGRAPADHARARDGTPRDVRSGLATMCIGVGQGIAMVVERERDPT